MNLKSLFLLILVLFTTSTLQAQDNLFKKLADNDKISTIIVSKELLTLAANMKADTELGGFSKFIDKVDRIEIYSTENNKAKKSMKKEIDKVAKKQAYEILASVKEENRGMIIYGQKSFDSTFKNILMFIDKGSSCSIIRLQGFFTMEDIEEVSKSSGKSPF